MDFDRLAPSYVRRLQAYPPGKPIEELEREYGITGSIKLASNENPLGPSPKAMAAVRAALAQAHRYPDGGCFYLRRALAAKLGVSPETLIIGNGSNELIELAVRTFMRASEEAVMADQAFAIYRLVTQAQGCQSTMVPLRNFTHDLAAIADAVTSTTRMVFLANPNNPTGTIFFRDQWADFLASIPRDVIVVVDEAYAEFVDDPAYPDSLDALRRDRPVFVLRTFSKIHGLAGLRVGYGIAPPVLVEMMNRVRAPFNVNSLAQAAALAALEDEEHVERTRRNNRAGMTYLKQACADLGVETVPSWANFLLVRVGNGVRVYETLLRKGVIVRPLGIYGFPEHVRVSVGLPGENERFIRALRGVLGEEGISASVV